MEKLDQYISGLFARMPDTANRIELESKVRNEADERYRMLLDEGYNEAEALGLVIPRINEQEILKQLHYPSGAADGEAAPGPAEYGEAAYDEGAFYYPKRPEAEQAEIDRMVAEYNHFRPRFNLAMAVGSFLVVVGIVLAIWLGIQYENPAYVVVGFFAPVAVAVFIFVLYGTRQASYTNFFRAKEFYEYLSPEVSERLRRQKARYRDYAGERRFREFD